MLQSAKTPHIKTFSLFGYLLALNTIKDLKPIFISLADVNRRIVGYRARETLHSEVSASQSKETSSTKCSFLRTYTKIS